MLTSVIATQKTFPRPRWSGDFSWLLGEGVVGEDAVFAALATAARAAVVVGRGIDGATVFALAVLVGGRSCVVYGLRIGFLGHMV